MRSSLLSALLSVFVLVFSFSSALAAEPSDASADFARFLREWQAKQTAFANGNPRPWKESSSHRDDVTIFGAFGGYEKGWASVGPRYDWAAAQHKPSGTTKEVEYLTTFVDADLAVAVSIERDDAQTASQEQRTPRALRVTQVFRREGGAWKLVHRHADPLLEKRAP